MFKKIINSIFFIFLITFIFLIVKYYISDKYKIFTNKSRATYLVLLDNSKTNVPTLENDTNNIIIYKNDIDKFRKKKRPWEKLISD